MPPKDIENLSKVYDNALRSMLAPRPFAGGFISHGNEITNEYKVPKGLTKEQAMLATLGAIMDSKVMEHVKCLSSPASTARTTDWGRTFLFRDFAGRDEKRGIFYCDAINEGRNLAREAFEAYDNGDPSKVNEMIARAGKIIKAEYIDCDVHESYTLLLNTSSAMKLVKEASSNNEMKALTGFDQETEELYNGKETIVELVKENVFNDRILDDKKNENTQEFKDALLEKTVNEMMLDAYSEEYEHRFDYAPDEETTEMLPKYEETGMPDPSIYLHESVKDVQAQAASKLAKIFPTTVDKKLLDDSQKESLINELKDVVLNSEAFNKAVAANDKRVYGDIDYHYDDNVSEEEKQNRQDRKDELDSENETLYKNAFEEMLSFEEKINSEVKAFEKKIGKKFEIVNKPIIDDKFKSFSKYVLNQRPFYLADPETGDFFRCQSDDNKHFNFEKVEKLPEVPYSSTLNVAYGNSNLMSQAIKNFTKVAVSVYGSDNPELIEQFETYKKAVTAALTNNSDETKDAVYDAAHSVNQIALNCKNLTIKNNVRSEMETVIDGLEEVVNSDNALRQRIAEYDKTHKSNDFDSLSNASREHEKLAGTEDLRDRPKAAGDRNLEANSSLSKYIAVLKAECDENPEFANGFSKTMDSLEVIKDYVGNLYQRDDKGELPRFEESFKQDLFSLYSAAFEGLEKDYHLSDDKIAAKQTIADIKATLSRDVAMFTRMNPTGEKSLAEEVDSVKPIRVNVTGKEFSTVGAKSNQRTAMTIQKDGKEIQGFFTDEKALAHDPERYVDLALEALESQHRNPVYFDTVAQAIRKMVNTGDFAGQSLKEVAIDYAKENGIGGQVPEEGNLNYLDFIIDEIDVETDFSTEWGKLTQEKVQYQSTMNVDSGTNVSNRNVAMSKVAMILGIPNIIAKSENIQIVDGDKVKNGVFMEKAEGFAYSGVLPDELKNLGENPFDNPSVLKDMADIQILDYICQNIDRHQDNVFYKLSEDGKQIVGLQGIDNDLSFGTTVVKDDDYIGNSDNRFNDIKVVSKSVRDKLFSMDENLFKASLGDVGLAQSEINAAVARFNKVKEAITANKIEVLSDEAFAKKSLKELAGDKDSKSMFARMNNISGNFKTQAERNLKKKLDEEEKIKDGDIEPQKPFTFEKVDSIDPISTEQFMLDYGKATEINDKIRASQKEIWGRGSDEFKYLKKAMETYTFALRNFPKEPFDSDYRKLQAALEDITKRANDYLVTKNPEETNKKTLNRMKIAKEVKEYFENRLKDFKEALHRKDEISVEEMNAKLKAQAEAIAKQNPPESEAKNDEKAPVDKVQEKDNPIKAQSFSGGYSWADYKEPEGIDNPRKDDESVTGSPRSDIDDHIDRSKLADIDPKDPKNLPKLILNDILAREKVSNKDSGEKGAVETLIEKGFESQLIETISKLDVVQEKLNNNDSNEMDSSTLSKLSSQALGEIAQKGKPSAPEYSDALVNDGKNLETDFEYQIQQKNIPMESPEMIF